MNDLSVTKIYQGGCHCGAVKFEVTVTDFKAVDCNCSICHKKGFLHCIVPPEQFVLLQGKEFLSTYRFNTRQAEHTFCRVCGIHPFYSPRSHPGMVDVNVRCLEGGAIADFTIEFFDGLNWEANIAQITEPSQPANYSQISDQDNGSN